MADSPTLTQAFEAIDAVNAEDPNRSTLAGEARPKELVHAELACRWVERLQPDAGDALRIAARAHHIRRWAIPRSEYSSGRRGYNQWRRALHDLHAREVGAILARLGYAEATVTRVQDLVRKRNLGRDPEVQTLEDALCLVFFETQLGELAERFDAEKRRDVVRKILAKMSVEGIRQAESLPLDPVLRALIADAGPPR